MAEDDCQKARASTYKLKETGDNVWQRILNINTKMTAGKLVPQCHTHHLGKHVLE